MQWKLKVAESGHEVIAGTIGMGKSYLVAWKVVMSFVYGRPCCYIDPKGDTYRLILSWFANDEIGQAFYQRYRDRIFFINPVSATDRIVGFNAIAPLASLPAVTVDPIALLANSLTSHIRRESGFDMNEANRMQNIMSAAIATLVEGGGGRLSLSEIPLLFRQTYTEDYAKNGKGRRVADTYNPFTSALLSRLDNFGSQSFWRDQWANWNVNDRKEWTQSTLGRVFRFLVDSRVLFTTCTVENSRVDFSRLVTEGGWLFANIPYQYLTDSMTAVLGNFIISQIFLAAMQQGADKPPYRLILDEARFFNSGPLDVILETSRAYNLWLTLVVQSLDQMAQRRSGYMDWHLRDTALNTVRYFTMFHNSHPDDRHLLTDLMFPGIGDRGFEMRFNEKPHQPARINKRRFLERGLMDLQQREVIMFDKFKPKPEIWKTPDVLLGPASDEDLAAFEEQHLADSGVPSGVINQEIRDRQARIRQYMDRHNGKGSERDIPDSDMGGEA